LRAEVDNSWRTQATGFEQVRKRSFCWFEVVGFLTIVRLPLGVGQAVLVEVIRPAGALRSWKAPKS